MRGKRREGKRQRDAWREENIREDQGSSETRREEKRRYHNRYKRRDEREYIREKGENKI